MNERLKQVLDGAFKKTAITDDGETWNVNSAEARRSAETRKVASQVGQVIHLDQFRPHEVTVAAQTAQEQVDQRAAEQSVASAQDKEHSQV